MSVALSFLGFGSVDYRLSQLRIQGRAHRLDFIGDASRIGLAIVQAGDRTPYAIIVSLLRGLPFGDCNLRGFIIYQRASSNDKPGGEYGCYLVHRLRNQVPLSSALLRVAPSDTKAISTAVPRKGHPSRPAGPDSAALETFGARRKPQVGTPWVGDGVEGIRVGAAKRGLDASAGLEPHSWGIQSVIRG
jgi:hypothetical protein